MPEFVVDAQEISLNSEYYRIKGPVRSSLTSNYPPKVIQGDTNKDSQQYASVVSWSDWSGGFGKDRIEKEADLHRGWLRSTCQLRYPGHLAPTFMVRTTASAAVAGVVPAIGELSNTIYAAFGGTSVRSYNNGTDAWSVNLQTLPAAATDVITVTLAAGTYLIFASTGAYDYTTDGTTWVSDTQDTQYLTFWDDRLWGISAAGQLWFATAIGAETLDAQLLLPSGSVTALFTGPNASGDEIIYVATNVGLYAHDAANVQFVKTGLVYPRHANGGLGSVTWRGDIYVPVGQSVFRYIPGFTAVVQSIGPDADGGMATTYAGNIRKLIPGFAGLIALVDDSLGDSSVLEYTGKGWQVLWEGNNNALTGYIGSAYSVYRLWFSESETNADVLFINLPTSLTVPGQSTAFNYQNQSTHNTPWFTGGQVEVNKLALRLRVETQGMTANDTVQVRYYLNYDDATATSLGTITSNGVTTYEFPNSTTPSGTAFRAIRFDLIFTVAAATTAPPDVRDLSLEWRKKLSSKWGHRVTLLLNKEYKGATPQQAFTNVRTAVDSNALVEFTFRNDATAGAAQRYYVDVIAPVTSEATGPDYRGEVDLLLVEP